MTRRASLCCWLALAWAWAASPPARAEEGRPAELEIRVHPDAVVEIDGEKMTQDGEVRRFTTPPLTPGTKYSYTLKATWTTAGGARRAVTRKVSVQAGWETRADLRLPWLGYAPFGPGVRSGYSTLTVVNGTLTDAVVKVIQTGRAKKLVRSFYVPQGASFTAREIPAGRYFLRVAFGSDWDMVEREFTTDASYSETESFKVIEEATAGRVTYSRMRVTLHKVIGGKFTSTKIPKKVFDEQ
jgi:uncharacterized protein (TIGR03000 family)